ncbi:protein bcn92 [Teleopsis dalmanni]|uniref:protein bcn92 n=1 Tax=Teleopsis dalmanni TaxID=139649 RepID=UPI0018CDBFB5|nr:protein bcn92 [Teleopsis dalmanni]
MSMRRQVISLYRKMLRESGKLGPYNFRMYAIRKIRDTFRTNRTIDFEEISRQLQLAEHNLEIIRRQAIIGHLYNVDKLVIEQSKKSA